MENIRKNKEDQGLHDQLGNEPIARLLVEHGADVNDGLPDDTASDIAESKCKKSMEKSYWNLISPTSNPSFIFPPQNHWLLRKFSSDQKIILHDSRIKSTWTC